MVEADLERAEERAELGEKYVPIKVVVDVCFASVDVVFIVIQFVADASQISSLYLTLFAGISDSTMICNLQN